MTKVSIITPCYNASQYIRPTFESIQKQKLEDWEWIVVDDGSTDDSASVVRNFGMNDARIKLIQKENGGTASARRLGLEHATGEYIQFLDADDLIDSNKLQYQVDLMDKEKLQVSYTDWCYISPSGEQEKTQGMNCGLVRQLAFWGTFGTIPIHSFLYRRDFLKNNAITFTTAIKEREDWDFHIEVFSARPKIERLEGYCGAFYTKASTGKTTGASQEKIQIGTFKFLLYKINHVAITKKILLYLRFSIELCLWMLRKLKYKNQIALLTHPYFQNDKQFKKAMFMGIVLAPIAIVIIAVRFIITRCNITHSI